jgi:hypothetical protein
MSARTTPTHEELARRTRQIHRKRFWSGVRYRIMRVPMRSFCLPRCHAKWGHQSMLAAWSTHPSKRCRWCGRLVIKPEFRGVLS